MSGLSRHRWFAIFFAVFLAAGMNLATTRGVAAERADAGASMTSGAGIDMGTCAERGGMTAGAANEMHPYCNEPADGTCTSMGNFCQSVGAMNLPKTFVLSAAASRSAYSPTHFHRSGRLAVPDLTPPRFS